MEDIHMNLEHDNWDDYRFTPSMEMYVMSMDYTQFIFIEFGIAWNDFWCWHYFLMTLWGTWCGSKGSKGHSEDELQIVKRYWGQ